MAKRPKRLLDQVREAIRRKHDSIRTENAYALGSNATSQLMAKLLYGR